MPISDDNGDTKWGNLTLVTINRESIREFWFGWTWCNDCSGTFILFIRLIFRIWQKRHTSALIWFSPEEVLTTISVNSLNKEMLVVYLREKKKLKCIHFGLYWIVFSLHRCGRVHDKGKCSSKHLFRGVHTWLWQWCERGGKSANFVFTRHVYKHNKSYFDVPVRISQVCRIKSKTVQCIVFK